MLEGNTLIETYEPSPGDEVDITLHVFPARRRWRS
jgi:hypothetical protein